MLLSMEIIVVKLLNQTDGCISNNCTCLFTPEESVKESVKVTL